ncbi:gephyrin isoform X2 [Rhipicephalus sanguineus]|uniref:gephyrin isoform X2 n=1 Tax=Rhipicephalus sanguineus TaxID=34632 RepID=UPI0018934C70|nr:gephyrin isoform X2 [Rhipicephalus sanguineus]
MDSKHCITTGILTVSDRCSRGEAEDSSGRNLEAVVNAKTLINGKVVARHCVPDDIEDIKRTLLQWSDVEKVNLILTTGGTGFSARDVTPEATRAVITKEAPGIAIAIIQKSLSITPMAMLSRLVCGIRNQSLIINLPGSRKGAQECFEFASPAIPHAVDQLQERKMKTDKLHSLLSVSGSPSPATVSHGCQCTAEGSQSSTVASRPRHSPYPLISVADAQAIVLEQCSEIGVEQVSFQVACGRILAEDVHATDPLPPFSASIKDGYAVIASDGDGPREVVDAIPAGSNPLHRVKPGQCVRISTGAPVPEPCDAVVQVEDTELIQASEDGSQEFKVNILVAPTVGQDIRPVGSDIQRGQRILTQRMKLSPSDLGLLATIGTNTVAVYRLPQVAVLSTGNEIVAPDSALKPGQIRDSNKTTLITLLQKSGFPVFDAGIARDEFEDHVRKLKNAFNVTDVVVSSGGVSMGEKDLLKAVLVKEFSATIHFGRVLMKPGKPTAFASLVYGDKLKLVFGLPGNPVSAAVTCQLYVLPALRKMSGHATVHPTSIRAKLAEDMVLDPRPEYHRAVLSWSEDCALPVARSTGNQISSRLLSLQGANALLVLPAATTETKALPAGTVVTALVTDTI